MPKFDRVKPGDPISADLFNQVADAIEAFQNLSVPTGGPLRLDTHPMHGHLLRVAGPQMIRAVLSGASSPYSWQEVEDTASGGTATFGVRSGTTNLYEINGKSGLGGTVQGIWWTSAGDWRFQAIRGLGQCVRTINVVGCNSIALPGQVVTLKQSGVTIATCTTGDGTGGTTLGQCSGLLLAPGTYDVSIPAGDGFAAFSQSFSHTCPGGAITFTRTADSSHVCVTKCAYPIPKVLQTTNALGTHTLTYSGLAFGVHTWLGSDVFVSNATSKLDVLGHCVADGGNCLYRPTLQYTNGAANYVVGWQFSEKWGMVSCGCHDLRYTSGVNGAATSAPATAATCGPFSADFNVLTSITVTDGCAPDSTMANPAGGGAYTVTP